MIVNVDPALAVEGALNEETRAVLATRVQGGTGVQDGPSYATVLTDLTDQGAYRTVAGEWRVKHGHAVDVVIAQRTDIDPTLAQRYVDLAVTLCILIGDDWPTAPELRPVADLALAAVNWAKGYAAATQPETTPVEWVPVGAPGLA